MNNYSIKINRKNSVSRY